MVPLLLSALGLVQPAPELTLERLLAEVERSAPAIRVQREAVAVSEARVTGAGAWAEPTVTIMGEGLPFGGEFEETMVSYRLAQPLNLFGRRGLAKKAARFGVRAERAGLERSRWDARAEAGRLFWELWMVGEMRRVLDRQLAMLGTMRDAALAQVRSGMPMGHHDVLRADAELASMQAERASLDDEERAIEAMLNALRGRRRDAPIGEARPPESRPPLPRLDDLLARGARRPELLAMRAMRDEMDARLELAGRETWPMVMVEAGYEQRIGMHDAWQASLMLTIPLWRQEARGEVAMTRAMKRRASRALEAMAIMTDADVRMAWSRAEAARRRLEALEDGAVPAMRETVRSAEASYTSGTGNFLALVEALLGLWQLEERRIEAVVALETARLELTRLTASPMEK